MKKEYAAHYENIKLFSGLRLLYNSACGPEEKPFTFWESAPSNDFDGKFLFQHDSLIGVLDSKGRRELMNGCDNPCQGLSACTIYDMEAIKGNRLLYNQTYYCDNIPDELISGIYAIDMNVQPGIRDSKQGHGRDPESDFGENCFTQ